MEICWGWPVAHRSMPLKENEGSAVEFMRLCSARTRRTKGCNFTRDRQTSAFFLLRRRNFIARIDCSFRQKYVSRSSVAIEDRRFVST